MSTFVLVSVNDDGTVTATKLEDSITVSEEITVHLADLIPKPPLAPPPTEGNPPTTGPSATEGASTASNSEPTADELTKQQADALPPSQVTPPQ